MIYLCYDSALNEEYTLVKLLQRYPGYLSLFKGTDDEDIWDAAPYLFKVSDNFFELRKDWLIQLDHCILFETSEAPEEICRFLQYYMYRRVNGKTSYFRIWDARVLLKYWNGCDERERVKFFEFFKAIYTEPENKQGLQKWQLNKFNKPVSELILKTDVLEAWVEFADTRGEDFPPASVKSGTAVAEQGPKASPPDKDGQTPKRRKFFIE